MLKLLHKYTVRLEVDVVGEYFMCICKYDRIVLEKKSRQSKQLLSQLFKVLFLYELLRH